MIYAVDHPCFTLGGFLNCVTTQWMPRLDKRVFKTLFYLASRTNWVGSARYPCGTFCQSNGMIAEATGQSTSVVKEHLSALRSAGLVSGHVVYSEELGRRVRRLFYPGFIAGLAAEAPSAESGERPARDGPTLECREEDRGRKAGPPQAGKPAPKRLSEKTSTGRLSAHDGWIDLERPPEEVVLREIRSPFISK